MIRNINTTKLMIDNRIMMSKIIKLEKNNDKLKRQLNNINKFIIIKDVILLLLIVMFCIYYHLSSIVEFRY